MTGNRGQIAVELCHSTAKIGFPSSHENISYLLKVMMSGVLMFILTLGAFAVFSGQRGSEPRQSALTPAVPTLQSTSTQAPYPPPGTLPAVTPQPTVITVYTLLPPIFTPAPPGTPWPTPLSARAALRKVLTSFPPDKQLVIDQNTIAVILVGKGDVHDLTETRDRMVIVLHHIPSLSVISIDASGAISSPNYKSPEGQSHLESIITNPVLLAQLVDFLVAYTNKLPK
ncbi:MAG: hypothetical protein HY259_01650 [Chloroflexi bacterium]|nr:hypothetical protein [Chloroflexota bacterium]